MGQVLGEPGAAAQQRRVLWDALGAFARIREPGGTVELPYRWKRDGYTDPLAERPAQPSAAAHRAGRRWPGVVAPGPPMPLRSNPPMSQGLSPNVEHLDAWATIA